MCAISFVVDQIMALLAGKLVIEELRSHINHLCSIHFDHEKKNRLVDVACDEGPQSKNVKV